MPSAGKSRNAFNRMGGSPGHRGRSEVMASEMSMSLEAEDCSNMEYYFQGGAVRMDNLACVWNPEGVTQADRADIRVSGLQKRFKPLFCPVEHHGSHHGPKFQPHRYGNIRL